MKIARVLQPNEQGNHHWHLHHGRHKSSREKDEQLMSFDTSRNPLSKQRIGLADSLAKQVTVFADRAEVRRSLTLDLLEGALLCCDSFCAPPSSFAGDNEIFITGFVPGFLPETTRIKTSDESTRVKVNFTPTYSLSILEARHD